MLESVHFLRNLDFVVAEVGGDKLNLLDSRSKAGWGGGQAKRDDGVIQADPAGFDRSQGWELAGAVQVTCTRQ